MVWINSKAKKRQEFINQYLDTSSVKMLEIGAFASPTFEQPDYDISFMDWSSTEELIQTLHDNPEKAAKVVEVDYAVQDKNFADYISDKFDLVIANHVVEHIPDLITWLQNMSKVLNEEGLVFLAVPHKEYTFDKIRCLTSLAQVIRNYHEDLNSPSVYQVFDHIYFRRPISVGSQVWNDDFHHLLEKKEFNSAGEALQVAQSLITKKGYVDAHCNVFSSESFIEICKELKLSGYIDLEIMGFEDVQKPYNEFLIILRKSL
jgi:predicted SAM-dependent methyltransferase